MADQQTFFFVLLRFSSRASREPLVCVIKKVLFYSFSSVFDCFRPCERMRKHGFAGRNTQHPSHFELIVYSKFWCFLERLVNREHHITILLSTTGISTTIFNLKNVQVQQSEFGLWFKRSKIKEELQVILYNIRVRTVLV